MPTLAHGQLSHHLEKGYRVCVGTHVGADGKVRPRTFWLGHDLITAQYAAHQFRGAWNATRLTTGGHWDTSEIQSIQKSIQLFVEMREAIHEGVAREQRRVEQESQFVNHMFGPPVGAASSGSQNDEARARVASEKASIATLYGGIAKYLEQMRGKRLSESHKARADRILNLNLKNARKDCALSEIDFVWIDGLCDHFKSRPVGLKRRDPISAATVGIILRYLRAFFVWMDDAGFGGWEAPRKLLKPFRCQELDLMTPSELRSAGQIKQFDIKTLKKLYGAASSFQKTLMLTALFTGCTQQELAVLEKSEFDLDRARLEHYRNKTKVLGRYWLPAELVHHLREEFAKRPEDPLAFRTSDGNALITYRDGHLASDSVRQSWDDLRERAGIPNALSFKYLRKYLGDWMVRHANQEIAQTALSHASQAILAKNYSTARNYEAFFKFQRMMYQEFKAQGFFELRKRRAAA